MIDTLALVLDLKNLEHLWAPCAAYCSRGWKIQKYNPTTGEVAWDIGTWEKSRSDDHRIAIKVSSSQIRIQGSTARARGDLNNVWGVESLIEAARAHVRLAAQLLPEIPLPTNLRCWRVVRADATYNYDLGGAPEVRQALAYLRDHEGGRYKVDTRRGETVYWSPGSDMRVGKAYHKGCHLNYASRKGQASATPEEMKLAERLLRLECEHRAKYWRERRKKGLRDWSWDPRVAHQEYFGPLIGTVEVAEMNELELFEKHAPTKGQALGAYRTWQLIKAIGHREAMDSMTRATWYRHLKVMKAAGLGWGDLKTGTVVPFRRRLLVISQPVESWDDLRRVA